MNSPQHAITVHTEHGQVDTCHLELVGEFDLAAVADLDRALGAALETAQHVEVDLDQTTFIDSTVIGTLVAAVYKARELGAVVVVRNPHDMVRVVLDATGVFDLLTHPGSTTTSIPPRPGRAGPLGRVEPAHDRNTGDAT